MAAIRRAVIDVGTNSVKLLVAEVAERAVHPILERSEQTRLGSGFYETHRLQPDAIAKTAQAVARFAEMAGPLQPSTIRVIATSAARDALNQADLRQAIQEASGLTVEVISGEQEADWVFAGVISDPELATAPLLILDVGGGSSEFILGEGAVQYFRESFRLGTVRLLESTPLADPPGAGEWPACQAHLRDFLQRQIRPALEPALHARRHQRVQLVGTGGTTTILARMHLGLDTFERSRIESVCLTREQVEGVRQHLWNLPLAARRQLVGLPPERADVILMGAAIFATVMEAFALPDLRTSTRGLRFAALMDAA